MYCAVAEWVEMLQAFFANGFVLRGNHIAAIALRFDSGVARMPNLPKTIRPGSALPFRPLVLRDRKLRKTGTSEVADN